MRVDVQVHGMGAHLKDSLAVVTLEGGHNSHGYDELVDVLSSANAAAYASVCGKAFAICENAPNLTTFSYVCINLCLHACMYVYRYLCVNMYMYAGKHLRKVYSDLRNIYGLEIVYNDFKYQFTFTTQWDTLSLHCTALSTLHCVSLHCTASCKIIETCRT
jgi:hypothetical protein